jgi:anti-repressor protein
LKFITEGNLYRLITKSKLPQADRFERWVFDEVIPQIRQTGGYISVNEEESDEEILSRALLIAQKKIDSKKLIIKQQQQLLIEQEDKVQSYNRIVNSNGLFNMREVAQLLNFEIGRNKLYEILRDKKVLNNYNLPYEVQLKAGRFEVKSSLKGGRMVTTTLVTPKGIDYINNLIIKEGRYKQRKAIS